MNKKLITKNIFKVIINLFSNHSYYSARLSSSFIITSKASIHSYASSSFKLLLEKWSPSVRVLLVTVFLNWAARTRSPPPLLLIDRKLFWAAPSFDVLLWQRSKFQIISAKFLWMGNFQCLVDCFHYFVVCFQQLVWLAKFSLLDHFQ